MIKKATLILLIMFAFTTLKAQLKLGETTLDTATVITGLDIPWEIQWGPDNHIWTTERYGRVSRIDPETGTQDILLDISGIVFQSGEAGLLGMVLHPDFETEPYVYLAYTYRPAGSILEKIVRYEYDGEILKNEFVLLDNIQGNTTHDGCRLIILPDYTLVFTTGDAQNQPAAQNLNHLSGKVLRLNLDGSIPEDNPFPGNPVYSLGHRNAQGLYLAPNGIIYSSEHGPSTDDELNIIEPSRNYGWPNVHGFCDLPAEQVFCEENNVKEPLVAWTPTVAASDLIYYEHFAIPEWEDKILMTTLKNKRLYVLELNEAGTQVIGEEQLFTNWWGRLRDICMSPDGAIYLATNGPSWTNTEPFTHSIIKVWNPETVSVKEWQNEPNQIIRLYPNPARQMLNVYLQQPGNRNILNIHNTGGQLVGSASLLQTHNTINIADLQQGLYLVTLEKDGKVVFRDRLIVAGP